MKKRTTRGSKLSLDRATLRALTRTNLRGAQGGTDRHLVMANLQTQTCNGFIMQDSVIVRPLASRAARLVDRDGGGKTQVSSAAMPHAVPDPVLDTR